MTKLSASFKSSPCQKSLSNDDAEASSQESVLDVPCPFPGHQDIKSRRLILVAVSVVNLSLFLAFSVLAPFFPGEATLKGLSATTSGFIFSVYPLVMMLAFPVLGHIQPKVGVRFLLLSGIAISGVSDILFGLLDKIEDKTTFTVFCFVVRSSSAFGAAMFFTASSTSIIQLFPDNVSLAFAITETCIGVGASAGPAIGGFLYDFGGFGLPFYVVGSLILINYPLCWILIKPVQYVEPQKSATSPSLWKVIRTPKVLVLSLVITSAASSITFLDPTFEPHLRIFELSPLQVGLIFLAGALSYTLSSPISGWLAGRSKSKSPQMIVGLIASSLCYLLIGPSQITGLEQTLSMDIFAFCALSPAFALAFIPTFEALLDTVVGLGAPNDLATYSLVSGLWSCVHSFGEVIGSGLSGVFVDTFGFVTGANIVAAYAVFAGLVLSIEYAIERTRRAPQKDSPVANERTFLLSKKT